MISAWFVFILIEGIEGLRVGHIIGAHKCRSED